MKNLLFSFLLVVPLFSIAQESNSKDWNLVIDYTQTNKSSYASTALFQDSILLVNGCVNQIQCGFLAQTAYNLQGERLWWSTGGNFVKTDSNYIYVAGLHKNDDTEDAPLFIKKFDANGDTVFTRYFWEFGIERELRWQYRYKLVDMELTENGKILIASNYSVVKSNIEGTEFKEELIRLDTDIVGIEILNDDTYLIQTEEKLYKADSSLSLVDSIEFGGNFIECKVFQDTLYSLFSTQLIRLSQELNIIDTLFATNTSLYEGMELYEGSLWLHAQENFSSVLIETQGDRILGSKSFELELENVDFTITKDNFLFTGNSKSQQIGIYNFNEPADSTVYENVPDIAIVGLEAEFLEAYYPPWFPDSIADGSYFSVSVTVENRGTQAIDSYRLYAALGNYINCSTNYLYAGEQASMLPGEIATVNYSRVLGIGIDVGRNVCIEVLAPNAEIEANISNNKMCTQLVTSIPDSKKLEANIKVFPNPASDQLRIEHPKTKLDEIQLLDMAGKLIGTFEPKPNRSSISLADLPKGLYFLKLISKDRYMTRKVMKE